MSRRLPSGIVGFMGCMMSLVKSLKTQPVESPLLINGLQKKNMESSNTDSDIQFIKPLEEHAGKECPILKPTPS
jgi:hypothetical protein